MTFKHAIVVLVFVSGFGCDHSDLTNEDSLSSLSPATDSSPSDWLPSINENLQISVEEENGTDLDGDGYRVDEGDCDDWDATIHPEAPERCGDGKDNNCDLFIDEPSAIDASAFYRDEDDDGFGNSSLYLVSCSPHNGFVDIGGDCDDDDPLVYPGAPEYGDDNIDYNCDGRIGR